MKLLLLLQVLFLSQLEGLSGLRIVGNTEPSNARPRCAFHFEGLDQSPEVEDPRVFVAFGCDKKIIKNITTPLSEATEIITEIEGIALFSQAAYLSIQRAAKFDMVGSVFKNLPPLPRTSGGSVAPIVINNTKLGISDTVISGNVGFDLSG